METECMKTLFVPVIHWHLSCMSGHAKDQFSEYQITTNRLSESTSSKRINYSHTFVPMMFKNKLLEIRLITSNKRDDQIMKKETEFYAMLH